MKPLVDVKVDRQPCEAELDKIQEIRATLPLQVGRVQTLQLAEAEFGISYSHTALSEKVRQSIPRRFFQERWCRETPIVGYRLPIPDQALLKYDVALKSGYFSSFTVLEPVYESSMWASSMRAHDPWLVGKVENTDRYIVIAFWE